MFVQLLDFLEIFDTLSDLFSEVYFLPKSILKFILLVFIKLKSVN